jgi:eukaryotic-like serine/threonine-protein kinase
MLRAVIKPPDDSAVRAKVAIAREDVAKVKALGDSGQCERAAAAGASVVAAAKAIGYRPLEAEAELELGRLGESCTDAVKALGELDDAVFSADASRHDQVSIEANLYAAQLYANRLHDTRMGRSAWRHGEAVLARFPGHPILEAWLADAEADISFSDGRLEEALQQSQRVLALKEKVLGSSHYDVAVSASNVALKLHALNRDAEAEPLIGRAIDLFTRLSGRDSTLVAVTLVNQAEILTSLGRLADAREALDDALATFRKQKASSFYLGYALFDLGNLEVAEGSARQAVATLEQAIDLLGQQDLLIAAQARFALARALWVVSPSERRRAVDEAAKAGTTIVKEPGGARLVRDLDDWRKTHVTR